jgi:hypothetical protein
MSAKQIGSLGSQGNSVSVAGREAALALSVDKVSVHKSGIEFHSPTPFTEWSEMTVSLQSPLDGSQLSCHGVVVACAGSKHSGYHISMIFTSMTPQAEKQLGVMVRSEFGAS